MHVYIYQGSNMPSRSLLLLSAISCLVLISHPALRLSIALQLPYIDVYFLKFCRGST